ncbi:hypothetical protein HMI55_001018 [Coelomomyces lativittatus]|nr:hypothetical protein HMI55_001018 [Coelomomyces lativittatus]
MFSNKSKKLVFQVELTVNSLENVPLLDGLFYVKLKLNRSAYAYTEVVSPRSPVIEHTVVWKWDASFKLNMGLSEDNTVMPSTIRFGVKKDKAQEKRSERIGSVSLDLAHFVGSKSSSSKHLLQDARINSLLKVCHDSHSMEYITFFLLLS